MGPATIALLILALAVTTVVLVHATRRPILWRMARRNATRRPRQTATVIAGLMVGTAIISAALVAGESVDSAVRGKVYQTLGETDEMVSIDGLPFYAASVYSDFLGDPRITGYFDAVSPNLYWRVAAEAPESGLFEPDVDLLGFDPGADATFDPFRMRDGPDRDGSRLGPQQAILRDELADALEVGPGDTVRLTYTLPVDPATPDIHPIEGEVVASADPGFLPGIGDPTGGAGGTTAATHTIPVERGADRIIVLASWTPATGPGTTTGRLVLELEAPDGTTYRTEAAVPGEAFAPVVLNATVPPDEALPPGDWTLRVSGSANLGGQYQGAAAVLYPVYELSALQDLAGDPGQDIPEAMQELVSRFTQTHELELEVAGITTGGRGDLFDFRYSLFMPLQTAQEALEREGEINFIKLSNPGGVVAGGDRTDEAFLVANATLSDIKEAHPDVRAIQALKVHTVKQDFLRFADEAGEMMTGILLFAGSLAVIAGMMLIINIFTMLAEERRSELGMARAVGLRRRDLVALFRFEGALYAAAAAAIGTLLGLGLAAGMIFVVNRILGAFDGTFPPIPFAPSAGSLLVAFAVGLLLTFATIEVASRNQAHLNIVRAIRQVPDPERAPRGWTIWLGAVLLAAGLAATTVGWLFGQFTVQVLGPVAVVAGAGLMGRPFLRRRRLYPILAAATALYYGFTYFTLSGSGDSVEANIIGPIRGTLLTLAVVVLLVHWEAMPRFMGRFWGRLRRMRAVALPAFSYPLHKRLRTGLTLAMFAIVILAIGFFSIFGALFETDVERHTGGFDIEATTTLKVADLDEHDQGLVPPGAVETRADIARFRTGDPDLITVEGGRTGQYNEPGHSVFGIDQTFVDAQQFRLLWRLDAYADDAAAYQALLEEEDVVIVGYSYSTDERNQDLQYEVGDTLQIHIGATAREYTIIGIQEQFHFQGIWLPKEDVESMFPNTDNFYLYRLADGVDAGEMAKTLERNHQEVGMDAKDSKEEVLRQQEAFRQILGGMKVFLGLGLIVGVLSLGIITSRSVMERRQEIGMLRAIGYTRNQIRRIFFTEVSYIVVLGTLIGFLASVLVTYGLWFNMIRELGYPYVIPWSEVALLFAAAYAVALSATVAPIRRSARVAPAEALRYLE